MKSDKVRKILFCFLVALFVVTIIGFALTTARYSGERDASPDGGFNGDIDYIVSSQTEVHSVEEFLSAVANGYPNIKIADDVPNPFLVTSGMEQVYSDLILDLNGHDIQRNSRDPMLEIAEGVKMVVIDTSKGGSGSFYNPVGSVLSINGGTLTVISGMFESGVREKEYYAATGESGAHGTIDGGNEATLYIKQAGSQAGTGDYGEGVTATVPIITPKVNVTSNGGYYVNGNLYIDGNGYEYLYNEKNLTPNDTYLFYAIEDADASNTNDIIYAEGSADFYYEYYVMVGKDANGLPSYTYKGATKEETDGDEVIKVTIYGYYDDIASAENATSSYTSSSPSNFAAIKMESGSLYVRAGNYYSYFGVDTAYCVYATGGLMSVENGLFEALKKGVCIDCSFAQTGTGGLSITGGSFKSYLGDTIQVNSGKMVVTGGAFTKDATAGTAATKEELANGSAIAIRGGMLLVTGADDSENTVNFNIYGSYACGIECASGSDLDIKNAVFNFNQNTTAGTTNVGIYNKSGDIEAENCLFRIPDDNSTGIVSTLSTTAEGAPTLSIASSIFSMTGKEVKGIRATAGTINLGKEESIGVPGQDHYVMFYIDHVYNCYGVYVEQASSANIEINANTAQFIMGQYADSTENAKIPEAYSTQSADAQLFNGAGIFMNASGATLNIKRTMICSAGSFTAGVYMKQGTLVQETDTGSTYKFALLMGVSQYYYGAGGAYDSTFIDNTNGDLSYNDGGGQMGHRRTKFGQEWFIAQYGSGHYAAGEAFNISQANARGSYGVFSSGGSITVSNFYVALYSTYGYAMYSKSGTISVEDFECDVRISQVDAAAQTSPAASSVTADITSAAIRTNGGNVNIRQSNVITTGYGYIVEGGNLVFANAKSQSTSEDLGKNSLVSERATAVLVSNGKFELQSKETLDVTCTIADSLNDFNGTAVQPDGIYVEGGSLESLGTLNMTFKGLNNDEQADVKEYQPLENLIKSYAVRVKASADSTVIIYSGSITSEIGGGVYVEGGNVTLGNASYTATDKNALVQVSTLGDTVYSGNTNSPYSKLCGSSKVTDNWRYFVSKTGGHAVKVAGGNLTIYYGTYSANVGNGILVSGGKATVYDGSFNGGYKAFSDNKFDSESTGSGLGSYYGLLLYKSGTFISYGGTYQGFNGGAFITGTDSNNNANAYIYGGKFSGTGPGANGISMGVYTAALFGISSSNVLTEAETDAGVVLKEAQNGGKISVTGLACAIALENSKALGTTITDTTLNIYKGTYMATREHANIIWRGNTSSDINLADCTFINLNGIINSSKNYYSGAIGNPYDSASRYTTWDNVLVDGYSAYQYSNFGYTKITAADTNQLGTIVISESKPNDGWSTGTNSITFDGNTASQYKLAFTQDTVYSFNYAVSGGSLTITYLGIDGETKTTTIRNSSYTGAKLYIAAASTITFSYSPDGETDSGSVEITAISQTAYSNQSIADTFGTSTN